MTRLDEKEIIKIFQQSFGNKKFVSEDVEVFKIGKNFGVIKIDTLIESTDIPPQISLSEVARKSIVACISDFAAKGVRPLYSIISISIPRRYSRIKLKEIAKGFRDVSKEFGFKILGGDTNEGKELVISVSFFGISKKISYRKGAKNGDSIIVTGQFGNTAAGLHLLLNGGTAGKEFVRKAKTAVFHSVPKLDFGISASKYFSSSMDSSDGLSTTLVEMALQSKKKFVITNLPIDIELEKFAKKNKLSMLDLVFNGGEEYEIVGTTSPKNLEKIKQIARTYKVSLIEIGKVKNGCGVFLKDKSNDRKIKSTGWLHFRN